jgi:S1-C subfamily serine protease
MEVLAMSLLPTLAVLCLLAPPAVETPVPPPAVVAKADLKTLYKQLVPNTCWIIVEIPEDPDSIRMGTGWVYDAQRRLVVTNEHVIRGMDQCDVHFPKQADGKIVVDPDEYLERGTPIRAEVIDRDEVRDLALLQLRSLPKSATGVKLAADLPEPGERLLTIAGLPDGSEGLWVMTTGTVRLSYRRNIATGSVTGVVETDLPFNAGNSGGPVVNEVGELVAVVEGYEVEARAVSMTIDVGEVRPPPAQCRSLGIRLERLRRSAAAR